VDEFYEAFIRQPLLWISERVFLGIGDRRLFDGTLHTLAALGRGTAAALSRVQTGSLHSTPSSCSRGSPTALYLGLRHV
jgi:hypothetical protein